MSGYELWKLLHVLAAILWIGGGVMEMLLSMRMRAAGDHPAMATFLRQAAKNGAWYFPTAALSTLVFGVIMVLTEDGLSFGDAWISIGLAGVFISGALGVGVLDRTTRQLEPLLDAGQVASAEAGTLLDRMLVATRIDVTLMLVVVWAMVTKPGA